MIKLTAQGKFIDTHEIEKLLTQGEKYSDVINIVLASVNNDVELSDCTFYMRTVSSNGSMTETMLPKILLENEIQLLWNVSEFITAIPGVLSLELIGFKGSECIIKYKMPAIYVKEAVMGEGLPVPDVIEEKLAQMNAALSQASEIHQESEALHSEAADLQRRTEELAEQITVSSEYVAEVTAARHASKTSGTYSTISERLAADFDECITNRQLYVVLGNEIGKAREEWQSDIENAIDAAEKSVFSGLTASFYGDSLTEENYHYTKGYHQWIKELLGLVSYNNYGVSGYKISDVYSKVNSINDTADIIFIMCSVNDENFSTPLGNFGDSTSGTIYGAYDALCRTLKEKYPTRLIVFITPHYQNKYPHNSGITSYEVSKAMKQVCEKYSIPVYDNFVLSGIGERNLSYWTTDNCHWNDKAHEMLGRNLAQFMKNTFSYYYGYNSGSGDEKPVLSVINQSISSASYDTENETLSLSGLNQTFGGVVFNDAEMLEIDVQTNLAINPDFLRISENGTGLGWILVRVNNGYKGLGFDFGDGLLETYDVTYDLTSWENRFTKDYVFDSSKNKFTVKIENRTADFYIDDELVYSIENAAALGYAMSSHKTGFIYGLKIS